MLPINLLKKAILESDWEKVILAYEKISGKKLPKPRKIKDNSSAVQNLNENTTKTIVAPKNEFDKFKTQPSQIQTDEEGRRYGIKMPHTPPGPNRFKDNLTEHSAEIKTDKKLTKNIVPTERREKFPTVKVKCRQCESIEEMPLSMAPIKAAADDEMPTHLCGGCIKKMGKGRYM